MKISLIVAIDKARGIGKNGKMPWHLSEDLKYFKAKTLGKPVIIGKNTFLSIGKPLPGRMNIVLTRDPLLKFEGCHMAHTLEEAIQLAGPVEEIMIIGGGNIYKQAIAQAQTIYLTLIDKVFDADTFFPAWHADEWIEQSREKHTTPDFEFYFIELKKK